MICGKKCRFLWIENHIYECSEHRHRHRCDDRCNKIVVTNEGEFCYLTGLQKAPVACVQHDYTHSCTRIVATLSKAAKAKRRRHAVEQRVRGMCPPSEVAAIIRTLYCSGKSREAAGLASAERARVKCRKVMHSTGISLDAVMQIMRVGVCTPSANSDDAMVATLANAISAFAKALAIPIKSQAAAAAFPVLFTATMCSKMRHGEVVDGLSIVPRVRWLGLHGFADVHFNQFKVSCRGMSGMWRRVKQAALKNNIGCSIDVGLNAHIGRTNPAVRNRYYPVCTSKLG